MNGPIDADGLAAQKLITSEITKALTDHPEFGSVGVVIYFTAGKVSRVTTSRETGRKPVVVAR